VTTPDVLLDCAPAFYLSIGDDGRVVQANTTLLHRLGVTRETIVGTHVETLLSRAGRLFYQTHVFPLIRMQGHAEEIFLLVETKSGEQFGTLWNFARRTRNEETYIDCVVIEVHERRKYEDALLQAKRQAEAANKLLEKQAAILADQAMELEAQHQQLTDQAAELEERADELQRANAALRDHSELVEQERHAAQEARRIADAANLAKSEFLATMSHELRTPLNAIGGYTDLLAAGIYGPVTPEMSHAYDRIVRAQRHLLGLINDVLNLARIESGRVDYTIATVRFGDVIRELREMIDPQVSTAGIEFRDEADDALMLRVDHEKLVQILLNLLSNAIKFTAHGGMITLRSATLIDRHGFVAIDIADTGRGIPAEKLEAVFEPFVQVRANASAPNLGTGLGLAISRNLARGMGGDLSATSELGKGSAFRLIVPRADDVRP
jgi:PAS domain S-box-containing protein